MKKYIFFLLVYYILSDNVFSQNISKYYEFQFIPDTISYFIKNEDLLIKREKSLVKGEKLYLNIGKDPKPQNIYFYFNETKNDSLPSQPGYRFPYFFNAEKNFNIVNNTFYYLAEDENKLELISFPDKKSNVSKNTDLLTNYSYANSSYKNGFLLTDKKTGLKLYYLSLLDSSSKLLVDLTQQEGIIYFPDKPNPIDRILGLYHFNKEKILILTGYIVGGMEHPQLYLLNISDNSLVKVSERFYPLVEKAEKDFQKENQKLEQNRIQPYFRNFYKFKIDSTAYIDYSTTYEAFIMNSEFELLGNLLPRSFTPRGVFEKDGITQYVRLKSEANDKKVEFNFQFKLNLEKSFYKIYKNQLLTEADLKQMNQYEIQLLKNFVFAKHNYQFDTPFYEAYYNTFSFYSTSEFVNNRTKNVNDKLTEQDISNLSLIKDFIE